jgi:hypothetical protein
MCERWISLCDGLREYQRRPEVWRGGAMLKFVGLTLPFAFCNSAIDCTEGSLKP